MFWTHKQKKTVLNIQRNNRTMYIIVNGVKYLELPDLRIVNIFHCNLYKAYCSVQPLSNFGKEPTAT